MAARGGPTLFCTYSTRENKTFNCKIWEAGRATSAAPTFFKRIVIGSPEEEEEFLDGGLGHNNPTRQLIEECKKTFAAGQKIGCIVSLGTGRANEIRFNVPGALSIAFLVALARKLGELATDSDRTAESVAADFQTMPEVYYRFNVDRGISRVFLEEWEKLGEVTSYTREYMKVTAVNSQINAVTESFVFQSRRGSLRTQSPRQPWWL
jgi:predicted acylesterase/phospholipase RssA